MTSTVSPFDPGDETTILARFESLIAMPVSRSNFADWLAQWNDLDIDVWETYTRLKRPAYFDITDQTSNHRYQRYVEQLFSTFPGYTNALIEKTLSVHPEPPSATYAQLWRCWQNQQALFHPDSLPIQAQISRLEGVYRDVMRHYVWDAENPSRYWLERRDELNTLFLQLLQLRRQLARSGGCATFLEYRWRELNRLDYTIDDCQAFHAAVEKMVPSIAQFRERQIPDLYYPEITDVDVLTDGVERILRQVDPEFGDIFHAMRPNYLDLGHRPNKAGAVEAWFFPRARMPYIHAATGNPGSVLHESGHAIHESLSFQAQRSLWNSSGPEEFQEFVATSVDMLSWDFYEESKGGLYAASENAIARKSVLQMYLRLTDSVKADAFEHWIYGEAPEDVTPAEIDAKWLELERRFDPWKENGGSLTERETGWQRWNWSLYRIPLYMISYPIAFVATFQFEQRASEDRANAIAGLKQAMRLGKTVPLPELFRIAGVDFPFTEEIVERAIRSWIEKILREG